MTSRLYLRLPAYRTVEDLGDYLASRGIEAPPTLEVGPLGEVRGVVVVGDEGEEVGA